MNRAVLAVLLSCLVVGCEPVAPEATDLTILQAAPVRVGFAPISYHVEQCANCHGAYGRQHDPARLRDMEPDRLTDITRQMTEGHGNLLIEEDELATLVAWHPAMAWEEAFVTLDAIDHRVLEGDISPGATVALIDAGQTIAGTVSGHRFRIELGAPPSASARLRVTLGGRTWDHPISAGSE